MAKPFYYGGQAVIEGVMIRGRRHMAIGMRRPDGEVEVYTERLKSAMYTSNWAKLPLIRGIVMLAEMLALGIRALTYSAAVASGEKKVEFDTGGVIGLVVGSLLFAVALFFVAPLAVINWADRFITSSFVSNVGEGFVRLGILLAYIVAISRLPDIRRVFGYHGAEHKVVNAFEAKAALNVERVQQFSTANARCGTAFLLTLVVISIFVFALLGRPPVWLRVVSRIALLPLIASVSYELLRLAAANIDKPFVRWIYTPNMALQRLTTREPDDQQVEVAVAALTRVLAEDAKQAPEPTVEPALKPVTSDV